MKTSAETRLLIASVKEVFRNSAKYKLVCPSGNMEALAETADFRQWLPQQTEQHFADPITKAYEAGEPLDAVSLANFVLLFYADPMEYYFHPITFETK